MSSLDIASNIVEEIIDLVTESTPSKHKMSQKKEKEYQQKPEYHHLIIHKKLVDGSKSRLDEIKDFVEKNEIGNQEDNLKNELNDILLEIVQKGSIEQLENYLHWFNNELLVTKKNAPIWRRWKDEIKAVNKNVIGMKSLNQPLIEASLKNDYHKVLTFLRNGFRINDSMFDDYEEWQNQYAKPAKEGRKSWIRRQLPSINPHKIPKTSSQILANFHASSTPAYLLGKYVHDKENLGNPSVNIVPPRGVRDPVSDAFKNAYIAENWMSTIENDKHQELQNTQNLKEILETSQNFISEMLNQCETRNEAAQFFSYDSKMKNHEWDKDNELINKYPRLYMAIELNYCDIFTHEYSQYMLGAKWVTSDHTGQIVKGYNTNLADRSLRFCLSIVLFPIYILCFLLRVMVHSDYYGVTPSLSFEEEEAIESSIKNTSWMNYINHACSHLMDHFSIPVNRYVGWFISHCIFLILILLSMFNPYIVEEISWPDYLLFIWAMGLVFMYVHILIKCCKSSRKKLFIKIWLVHVFDVVSFLSIFFGCINKFVGDIQICGMLFEIGIISNTLKTFHWTQHNLEFGTYVTCLWKIFKQCSKITFLFIIFIFAYGSAINHELKVPNVYCNETDHDRNTSEIMENNFQNFWMSYDSVGWSILAPGKPEAVSVGCEEASPAPSIGSTWFVFQWIMVFFVSPLYIAVATSTVMKVLENKIKEWKCARTRVWVNHFYKRFSLPGPFNMLECIVWLLVQVFRSNCNKKKTWNDIDVESNHTSTEDETEEKYNLLILQLTKRYLENKSN